MTISLYFKRWGLLLLLLAVASSVHAEQPSGDGTVKITLLQVNDVYQFLPVDKGKRGGLARLWTLKEKIKEESPNTLFLLAGDTISPSVESNSLGHKGRQMIAAWNTIGLDYAVFGNHEFDFGVDELARRVGESNFKWLGANVVFHTHNKSLDQVEHTVIREFGGITVGLFGIVLPETKVTNRQIPIDLNDPCETAQQAIAELKNKKADIIVALTHLSMQQDKELGHCAPGIDVILGGHEHTLLQSSSGRTPIFKMTADARELNQVDIHFSTKHKTIQSLDWKVIPVTDAIPDHPKFAPAMAKYIQEIKKLGLDDIIGKTSVALDARSLSVRTGETNLGNFITDAIREEAKADVALINGGSIRADTVFDSGDLTRRDIRSILPYQSPVFKITIKGETLLQAIEHGVANSEEDSEPGQFPQVSGVQFKFNLKEKPGSRVTEAKVNGAALEKEKIYTLASTGYILGAGDGYNMLKNESPKEQVGLATEIFENKIIALKTIAPKKDGRIEQIH